MAARANLVLKDRATPTPLDHTFTPDGDDANGVHVWSEKEPNGVAAGAKRLTASMRRDASNRHRTVVKTQIPTVATQVINGVSSPVVIRTAYLETIIRFEDTSTTQERADAVGIHANALAASVTQINDMIVNMSDVTG